MDLNSVGTTMYWCEGSKRDRDYRVEFVNSDPAIIKVFMKFLRTKGIEERRLRARVSVHDTDDIQECEEFWMRVTSLGPPNFLLASVRRTSPARTPLPHGTLTIRYNSIELLRSIKNDISELSRRLLQDNSSQT